MTQQIRKYGINPLEYCKYNPIVDFDSIQEQKDTLGVDDNTVIEFGKGVVIDEPKPLKNRYLTFTSADENSVEVSFDNGGDDPVTNYSLEYSIDGGETWKTYELGSNVTLSNIGDSVMFRGDNHECVFNKNSCITCTINHSASASGDITSIFNGVGGDAELTEWCFTRMFVGCNDLVTAPNLPSTVLADHCYSGMFQDCRSLTTSPALPATTLRNNCYNGMFNGCTALTTTPALPATTLAIYCYYSMFSGCTSLTTAPELPATTLADNCYDCMFWGCVLLATAPVLPSTTLAEGCYKQMFENCTSLTTAPVLPATTLADSCYQHMFYGCTALAYIKAMFTTNPLVINVVNGVKEYPYTQNWVYGVARDGTFVKNSAARWDVIGVNGIPDGWTVETD